MAEPAPTRRSSRTSPTPVQATPETPGTGRATVRRQAASTAPERPAVVWGRPVDAKRTDAAGLPAAQTPAPSGGSAPVAAAPALPPVAAEQVSRRTRRAQTGPQSTIAVSSSIAPSGTVPPIAAQPPAAPERPAATFEAELPTREEPAPLLDTVLVPAEPFELLEPAVEAAAATPVAVAETVAPSAADTGSAWVADTFAKLLAAQAAATVASTPAVVETGVNANSPATHTPAAPRVATPQSTAQSQMPDTSAPQAAESPSIAVPSAETQAQTTAPSLAVPGRRRTAAASQTPAPAATIGSPDAAQQTAAPTAQQTSAPRTAAPTAPRVSASQSTGAPSQHAEQPRPERVGPLTGPIPQPAASDVDEFEAAARLFSFTGETPVQRAPRPAGPAPEAESTQRTTSPSPARRGSAFRRTATASFSVGVLGIVGLLAVGMTTPAEAVAAVNGTDAPLSVVAAGDNTVPVIDEAEIQAYVAPGDAQNDTLQRTENYTTTTTAQLASEAGIKNFSNLFHNNPNSNIQWPFAVGVTMSYGFGMRSGRMHEGIDFTPGNGAPVQAIADGTVRVASEAGGAYGVHVIIDHIVDGELVSSHYAHMQYGSLQVSPGQHVTVGTVIGHTGNTGRSYGAHTHFEILKNGTTAIDPWPWLQEHTDGTHTVG